jgi:hypothetical protein
MRAWKGRIGNKIGTFCHSEHSGGIAFSFAEEILLIFFSKYDFERDPYGMTKKMRNQQINCLAV